MLFKEKKCSNCQNNFDPTLEKCPFCENTNESYRSNSVPKRVLFLHPLAQAGLFLGGFAYVGMLLTQLVVALCIRNFFSSTDITLKQTLLLTFTYLLMLVGLFAIPFFTRRQLFLSKYKKVLDYIYGIGYAVTLVCVGSIVNGLISLFYQVPSDNANQEAAITIAKNYPIIAFLILGVIGPICEEFTYRIGLYSLLRRISKYLAIILTSVIFALIHFDFASENMIVELVALPSYVISGLILNIAYEHRGPACSMTAHVLYNIFAFVLILLK
ncbi:MAG TPA: CPBP family intramembrane metalloprotease [Erysipelotrichaceae bacterium]|nr:CPBP family intramembrane metalloprotease [Erysipelotrichaceae bacterium]